MFYTTDYCATDIDECASNPCQNGGTCADDVNRYEQSMKSKWWYTGADDETIALVKLVTLERIVKQVGQHITINYCVTFF